MFFNMMTGNIQGYEDINSQRKIENNYKFTWNENIVEDIEKKIDNFGDNIDQIDNNRVDNSELFNAKDSELYDDSLYHGGDQRQRPSSMHSKSFSDSDSDNSENLNDDNGENSDDYEIADMKDEL